MDRKEFDKYIKDQLESLQSSEKGDWNEMYDSLNDEGFFDEDQNLDHIIKAKLFGLKDEANPSDWDTVKNSLIEESVDDNDFDSMLRSDIKAATANYDHNHWSVLRERLITEAYLKKRIAITKAIELFMIFLFFMGVTSIVPIHEKLYDVYDYRPFVEKVTTIFDSAAPALKSQSAQRIELDTKKHLEPSGDWRFVGEFIEVEQENPKGQNTKEAENKSVTKLEHKTQSLSIPQRDIYAQSDIYIKERKRDQNQIITAGLGVSHNMITAPSIGTVGISDQQYANAGYNASFSYGVQFKRIETFIGIEVNNVSYESRVSLGLSASEKNGDLVLSEINSATYTYLVVPLGLKYHVAESDKWSLYTTASANINIRATESYGLRELTAEETKLANSFPQAFNGTNQSLRAGNPSYESKGLFHGGSMIENLSLSATVGLGLIRYINDNTGIYLQPSYTHSLSEQGSGARKEKVNNYRVDFGVRHSF